MSRAEQPPSPRHERINEDLLLANIAFIFLPDAVCFLYTWFFGHDDSDSLMGNTSAEQMIDNIGN